MKNKHLLILAASASCVLASCGANDGSLAWDYEGEAQEDAIVLRSHVVIDETAHTGTLSIYETPWVFSAKPSESAVLFFDADAALGQVDGASSLEELPYSVLKDNELAMSSFSMPEDLDELTITFASENGHKVGALIHHNYTYRDRYALLTPYYEPEPTMAPIEVNNGNFEFEEKYINSSVPENKSADASMAVNVALNLINVGIGVGTGNYIGIVSGVLGIFNSIWNRFCGGPDIGKMLKEITKKLNEMDQKLDALSRTLAKNYEQLLAETIKTQGLVQDVMIRQMNSDVASFQETYINKADDIRREAGIFLQPCYREFVNAPTSVQVDFRKNPSTNKYERVLYADESTTSMETITVAIPTTAASAAFLAEHHNTLTEGFFDVFAKDMEEAVKGVKAMLPEGLSEEEFQSFLVGSIQEGFMKKFWQTHPEKLTEYTNILVNLCRRLNANDGTNILDSYLNRLKYMCNFSIETQNMAKSILAGLRYALESNVCNALLAGAYLHTDLSELSKSYVSAVTNIKNAYASWAKLPDEYSFVVGATVRGDAVSLMWENQWSKLGNHPDFATSLRLDLLAMRQKGFGIDLPYMLDIEHKKYSDWNLLSSGDYLKMSLRMRLMKELGLIKADLNFLDYLRGSSIMGSNPIDAYKDAVKTYGGIAYENALFLTPVESRPLQNTDKGLKVWCEGQGNPGGSWYKKGKVYDFKGDHDSNCWTGTGLECATVSVKTGTLYSSKQLVGAYARYDEGHSDWKNDEHWSYTMGNYVNPYFVLHY